MNILSIVFICTSIFISTTVSFARPKSTLLSVVQVFRHGERTPTSFYPNDPYKDSSFWPVSEGQLTNVGKQEHYALGEFTRRRYKNFIPLKYTKEKVYIQTTDYDRTFMSAATNLAGLFPPKGDQIWNKNLLWQPITIHPVERAVLSDLSTCSSVTNTLVDVLSDPYFVAIDEENAELYQYLSHHTGSNITSLFDVVGIRDTLYIEDRFNFPLPAWTDSVYPEPLTKLSAEVWQSLGYTEELRRISSGVFLNTLIQYFEDYLASATTVKYQQFSGHDINIASILHGLGAFAPHIPDFASTIYFELREKARGHPYINVYYKNGDTVINPVPITVKGCHFDCSLDDFKTVLSDVVITADEWYNFCPL